MVYLVREAEGAGGGGAVEIEYPKLERRGGWFNQPTDSDIVYMSMQYFTTLEYPLQNNTFQNNTVQLRSVGQIV